MARKKTVYICSNCQYESAGYLGKCPECGSWGSLEEVEVSKEGRSAGGAKKRLPKKINRLQDVVTSNSDRIITNIPEFNRVMGGGIVKDSVTILSAVPGAGKSTLLLQVANDLASLGHKVLYASGEESESQLKNRADRIVGSLSQDLWVVSDNSMDNVMSIVDDLDPKVIIVDSIQTFTLEAYSSSRAGSPTQTMECANSLVEVAKDVENPRVVIIVGQMTKENEIAGVRALEHLVDTVLIIEGESGEELRSLITTKNRYGSTGEMGFFSMTDRGMISIDNPSEYFMTQRKGNHTVAGSAITVVREGTRPIILEIESLVSQSFMPYPSRISECFRKDKLNTLISILEQRAGFQLYDKNVVIKAAGGIKLKEQSSNLAVLLSIVSSIKGIGIDNHTVFIGDVGLTGEIKKVPSLEQRIRELDRMGFKKAYVAPESSRNIQTENIRIIEKETLKQVIDDVFQAGLF